MRAPGIGKTLIIASFALVLSAPAGATIMWDESVDGDLSGDRFNPTALTIGLGTNTLIATSVQGDREYYKFTLADGLQLDAVMLVSYLGNDPLAFIAVQEGTVFTEPPQMTVVGNLLGYTHFGTGNNTVGTDILDNMGLGNGAIGFIPPLFSGDYVWWSQQTGTNPVTYQLDFIVSPAAPSLGLVLGGLACLRGRRRR